MDNKAKFTVKKFDGLDGHTKVRISKDEKFHVDANPFGIEINGTLLIESHDDLKEFANMINAAQDSWNQLKKTLILK